MEKPGPRAALSSPRDLAALAHDIRPDGVGETILRDPRRRSIDETGLDLIRRESALNGIMHVPINFERRSRKERMRLGNNDRIGDVFAVRNYPAACPAADDFAPAGVVSYLGITTEITERKRGLPPAIKAKDRHRGVREK